MISRLGNTDCVLHQLGCYIGAMKSELRNGMQQVTAAYSSKRQNDYLTALDVSLKKYNQLYRTGWCAVSSVQ